MKARHVPVACNQIADSPSLSFPAISFRVTGTGGERTAMSWPSSQGWTLRLRCAGGAARTQFSPQHLTDGLKASIINTHYFLQKEKFPWEPYWLLREQGNGVVRSRAQ